MDGDCNLWYCQSTEDAASALISNVEGAFYKMIKSSLRFAACVMTASIALSGVSAAPEISLEDRIDQSFSTLKIDLSEEEASKLKNVKIAGVIGNEFQVTDSNGVIHSFYDGLWQKMLNVEAGAPLKPIKALGIGMARTKKSALDAMRKFTGKKNFECDIDRPEEKETEEKFGSYQFCKQRTAGDGGYIWVEFDAKERLTRAGYQAWDPF